MNKKINFKLNCTDDKAMEYMETARHPYVEKGHTCENGDIRLYLMRDHKGLRYVEYVFDGHMENSSLSGELKIPSDGGDKPGLFKMLLLAFMAMCVLAAVFGAMYLFVLVIARNFWLSFYIALPAFGGIFTLIAIIALFRKRKKKQLANLIAYLAQIAVIEPKKKKKSKPTKRPSKV